MERNNELKVVSFANRDWYVVDSGNYLTYLRAVEPIKDVSTSEEYKMLLDYNVSTYDKFLCWSVSNVRRYLQNEFLDQFPEKDRINVFPVEHELGKLRTSDSVWLDTISIHHTARLDEIRKLDQPGKLYPCICVPDDALDPMTRLVDRFMCLYENEKLPGIDVEFDKMLTDGERLSRNTPLAVVIFLWYSSMYREDIEAIFECLTSCSLVEFLKTWIAKAEDGGEYDGMCK